MTAPMRAVLAAHAAGWAAAGGAVCVALDAIAWGFVLGAVAAFVLWDSTGAAVELGAALGSGPSGLAPRAAGGSGEQGRADGRARGRDGGHGGAAHMPRAGRGDAPGAGVTAGEGVGTGGGAIGLSGRISGGER